MNTILAHRVPFSDEEISLREEQRAFRLSLLLHTCPAHLLQFSNFIKHDTKYYFLSVKPIACLRPRPRCILFFSSQWQRLYQGLVSQRTVCPEPIFTHTFLLLESSPPQPRVVGLEEQRNGHLEEVTYRHRVCPSQKDLQRPWRTHSYLVLLLYLDLRGFPRFHFIRSCHSGKTTYHHIALHVDRVRSYTLP